MKNQLTMIVRPKVESMFTLWKRREEIPNQENYAVLVQLTNGAECRTKVIKDSSGCHVLENVPIASVLGWIPLPPELANIKPN